MIIQRALKAEALNLSTKQLFKSRGELIFIFVNVVE